MSATSYLRTSSGHDQRDFWLTCKHIKIKQIKPLELDNNRKIFPRATDMGGDT